MSGEFGRNITEFNDSPELVNNGDFSGTNGWTLGTARFVLSNNRFDDQQADYSESLQKAFFFMQNDSAGNTSVITLTGTGGQGGTYSASMDVAFSYNVASVAGAALSNGKIVLGQRNSSNRFATKVWQIAYTATNLESGNFIGFSAGSYSDGDTATVKIDSNTTTQSSFTPVKKFVFKNQIEQDFDIIISFGRKIIIT